jgi:hypothetical protein
LPYRNHGETETAVSHETDTERNQHETWAKPTETATLVSPLGSKRNHFSSAYGTKKWFRLPRPGFSQALGTLGNENPRRRLGLGPWKSGRRFKNRKVRNER